MYGGGNILKYEGWNVGSTIRRLRKEKNMTIEELSEAVGKSPSHIAQIEQGSRRLGINLLCELITVLETDANTILVVHRKNSELSIDKELMKLTPKVRIYFQMQFLNMIEEFPIK